MAPSPSSPTDNDCVITVNTSRRTPPRQEQQAAVVSRVHRACLECRRKKTKCDMLKPICGLCRRTASDCTFPTKRKTPEMRNLLPKEDPKLYKRRFERLVQLLESKVSDGSQTGGVLVQDPGLSPNEGPPETPESAGSPPTPCSSPDNNIHSQLDEGSSSSTKSAPAEAQAPHYHTHHISPRSAEASTPAGDSVIFESVASARGLDDSAAQSELVSLQISPALASELVGLYFSKVQCWLSLLHKPRFYARYMTEDGRRIRSLDGYTIAEALLIYSMFSLSARYSSSPDLRDEAAPDRSQRFTVAANLMYEKARLATENPGLQYLQACILLAFERYTAGPSHRAWILSGICVRMAYDLGLCDVDEADDDTTDDLDPETWSQKEELRRAWWHAWELDMFGSFMSRRPTMIDRRRMAVRLPVSDEAWFSGRPTASAMLQTDPSETWKSLSGCPNQDAKAWFLIANYLLTLPLDILQGGEEINDAKYQVLANAVACYSLALPTHLGLNSPSFRFDDSCFAQSNWVIAINIMMVSARSAIAALRPASEASSLEAPWKPGDRELSRIIRHWNPEYMNLCHPFIACQLIPTNPRTPPAQDSETADVSRSDRDLVMLTLRRHAEVWKLGSMLLYLRNAMDAREVIDPSERSVLVRNFAVYFPRNRRGTGSSTSPDAPRPGEALRQQDSPRRDSNLSPTSADSGALALSETFLHAHNNPPPPQHLADGSQPLGLSTFKTSGPSFAMEISPAFGDPMATSPGGWLRHNADLMYEPSTGEAIDFLRWQTDWPISTGGG